jgi:serine/threonine-protein kinase
MMVDRILGGAALAVVLSSSALAQAQTGSDAAAQADAFFKEAMQLRSAGNDAAACPKFAASKELAPAVGVTLYLAECYQRTGRNASAWREFRDGERLARERNDKRADVAAQRAAALEPTLGRLTVEAPASAAQAGTLVTVDGAALAPSFWGNALAVDPGDHVVKVEADAQPPKTFTAHVDANNPSVVVRIGEPEAAPAVATAAAAPLPAEPPPAPTDRGATGRYVGIGLVVVGAAGVGIGTWLVTSKSRQMDNGQLCDPHLRPHAIPEGVTALAVGGVALVTGVVLFAVNRPGRTEIALTPSVTPGGGGAVLSGSF